MVAAREKIDRTYGVKEYEVSRYDGKLNSIFTGKSTATKSDWNRKTGSFIDLEVKAKAFLPAPNFYERKDLGPSPKSVSLYKSARKTEFTTLIEVAKRTPIGPGSFNPKPITPRVTGSYGGLTRVTEAASIIASGSSGPPVGNYTLPSFSVTRQEPRRTKMIAESDTEKSMSIKKWERTDKPNPFSYKP